MTTTDVFAGLALAGVTFLVYKEVVKSKSKNKEGGCGCKGCKDKLNAPAASSPASAPTAAIAVSTPAALTEAVALNMDGWKK